MLWRILRVGHYAAVYLGQSARFTMDLKPNGFKIWNCPVTPILFWILWKEWTHQSAAGTSWLPSREVTVRLYTELMEAARGSIQTHGSHAGLVQGSWGGSHFNPWEHTIESSADHGRANFLINLWFFTQLSQGQHYPSSSHDCSTCHRPAHILSKRTEVGEEQQSPSTAFRTLIERLHKAHKTHFPHSFLIKLQQFLGSSEGKYFLHRVLRGFKLVKVLNKGYYKVKCI